MSNSVPIGIGIVMLMSIAGMAYSSSQISPQIITPDTENYFTALNISNADVSEMTCDLNNCYFHIYSNGILDQDYSIPTFYLQDRNIGTHIEVDNDGNNITVYDNVTDQINYSYQDLQTAESNLVISQMAWASSQVENKKETDLQVVNEGYVQNLTTEVNNG